MHRFRSAKKLTMPAFAGIVALSIGVTACGSGSNGACTPGASVSCACSSGTTGAQVCNAAGTSLGICVCTSPSGEAGAGGNAGGQSGFSGGFGGIGEGGSAMGGAASPLGGSDGLGGVGNSGGGGSGTLATGGASAIGGSGGGGGGAAIATICGNGIVETGESCDKGSANGIFYGDGTGCSRTCTTEPTCRDADGRNQACVPQCGDGHVDASGGEQCDDGNGTDGDGCSRRCLIEAGFSCTNTQVPDSTACTGAASAGQCIDLPIIYRDFKSERETGGHPDFLSLSPARSCIPSSTGPSHCGDSTARCWGIAQDQLLNGKPQLNGTPMCPCQFTDWSVRNDGNHVPGYTAANSPILNPTQSNSGTPVYTGYVSPVTSAESFSQWFNDSPASSPPNTHVASMLELAATGGVFRYSSDPNDVSGGFFPLDPMPAPIAMGSTATGEPLLCNIWPYWYSTASFGAGAGCTGDQYLFPPSIPTNLLSMSMCTGTDNPGCIKGIWVTSISGKWHNYWFTDEIHYYFALAPEGFSVQVNGDDDLYVFVNGVLVIDSGGTHNRLPGKVSIDPTGVASITEGGFVDALGNIVPCPSNDPRDPYLTVCGVKASAGVDCRQRTVDLRMEVGKIYELAIFGAERSPTASSYELTVSGMSRQKSSCVRSP